MTMPAYMNCNHNDEGWCLTCVAKLSEELSELQARIAKSSLIEVPATKVESRGGHPVIVNDGTMLVHKDYKIRQEQITKDLQAHAACAREKSTYKAALEEIEKDGLADFKSAETAKRALDKYR